MTGLTAVTEDNLHFGTHPDDPTGVRDCATCQGDAVVDATPCPDCRARQQLRDAWWNGSSGPERLWRTLRHL